MKKTLLIQNVLLCTFMLVWANVFSQTVPKPPVTTIVGPNDSYTGLPVTLSNAPAKQVYFVKLDGVTVTSGSSFVWNVSKPAGTIVSGMGTPTITVDWIGQTGQQSVSVTYTDASSVVQSAVLVINWNPFLPPIDGAKVPKFVDVMPHFAAGLRVNARAGGNMTVTAKKVQQVALSTGTVLQNGTIGKDEGAGVGNYAGYEITYGNSPPYAAMWPARTIETQVGNELKVTYKNALNNVKYSDFNILADQTLMMNEYPQNGNILTDPYTGDIPMVVHLHGGEMPSGSDGGPTGWFMPEGSTVRGPGFKYGSSIVSTYPNAQEEGTLWYHPHDQGLTRINVYTGLAGYYFLRGTASSEQAIQLPGWSGDDKVQEVTPTDIARNPSVYSANAYLPEIELAIQDRMFNTKGELFWPVEPTNPDIHPFWTPEFFGDVMTVNGKSWPYLSVAPRKYRFRLLDGCNARFLNIWLKNSTAGGAAPVISVIGSDGNMLDKPAILANTLLMAPGERYDVVIDFSTVPFGTVLTLMNNAQAPYPKGTPVDEKTTGQIMQFVVNGNMVSTNGSVTGADKSFEMSSLASNTNLRANPMVKLTDFNGGLTEGVTVAVKRQIILNEVSSMDGPVEVLFNNSVFDVVTKSAEAPKFGGPTELPLEGTTELIQIINTTEDAHPIHIHLMQWQLVSRQKFDDKAYMAAYDAAWKAQQPTVPIWPADAGYPGGAGSPYPYNTPNGDGAVGGNPSLYFPINYTTDPIVPANPEEMGWKDDVRALPGEITTYIVRAAPTSVAINAPAAELLFPFDPSTGPGYVWHCHIVDHEDMDMMRPLVIRPSVLRYPQIDTQPESVAVFEAGEARFMVVAKDATTISPAITSYEWQVSVDAGENFTKLVNGSPYSGVTTHTLVIDPTTLALTTYQYRVQITNIDGTTTSNAATLTVNPVQPITSIQAPVLVSCDDYDVEVSVQNFINVGNISLVMNYDPKIFTFQSVIINTAISSTTLSDGLLQPGQFKLSYVGTRKTLATNAVLFALRLKLRTSAVTGTTTNLTWSTKSEDCQYAGPGGVPVYVSTFNKQTWTIPERPLPAEVGTALITSTIQCASAAIAPTLPIVKDYCGAELTPSAPVITGTYADCEGTRIYTYTYTDVLGQQLVWVYTYTIDHLTLPVEFGGPVSIESTVACASEAIAPTVLPVIKDVCGNVIPTPIPVVSAIPACQGIVTYTYTYTDCSGLKTPWVYTYTISAPEVAMPLAGSSTVACLSAATSPVPPVVSDNCNRTLTVSAGVAGADPVCAGTKTWTFTYTNCASATSTWVYTYTIADNEAPTITCPSDITVNMNTDCTATDVSLGTPILSDNCNGALTVSNNAPVAFLEGLTTVTWTLMDCAGNSQTCIQTVTVVGNSLSGIMKYNNEPQTPMNRVTLKLTPGNATVTTGENGHYSFPGLCAGKYTIAVTDNRKDVGGINSTDAGAVNYWSTHFGSIEQVKFMAGDVNKNNFLSSDDALLIQRYFVFNEAFLSAASSPWSYWKTGASIVSNSVPYEQGNSSKPWPTAITVAVGGNVSNFDLYGMCTGDFNGSLTPTTLKSASWSMMLTTSSNMQVGANQEFELPLRAGSAMEVGAVSMILEIPSGLVNVQDVIVNGSNVPVMWAVKGNELRIGWNASTPVNVAQDGSLVTLKLKTTKAFTPGQSIDLALIYNPLNEIADGSFNVVEGATLVVAQVANLTVGIQEISESKGLVIRNYPNPFSNTTTVTYTLPVDGKVTIIVYDQLGQSVATLVDAAQRAGEYSIRMEGTKLVPGIYIAKLRLTDRNVDMLGTIKLSILK